MDGMPFQPPPPPVVVCIRRAAFNSGYSSDFLAVALRSCGWFWKPSLVLHSFQVRADALLVAWLEQQSVLLASEALPAPSRALGRPRGAASFPACRDPCLCGPGGDPASGCLRASTSTLRGLRSQCVSCWAPLTFVTAWCGALSWPQSCSNTVKQGFRVGMRCSGA